MWTLHLYNCNQLTEAGEPATAPTAESNFSKKKKAGYIWTFKTTMEIFQYPEL